MPKLNIELRKRVAELVRSGASNAEIEKETQYGRVKAIREILARDLPLDTRICRDGTINQHAQRGYATEEERRAGYEASQKRHRDKLKLLGVPRLKDLKATTTVEPSGAVNIVTDGGSRSRVEKHMILSCCTRQEQTPEEASTARKNFLSTSLKLLASDIVAAFPEVNIHEFDEILRKVSQ